MINILKNNKYLANSIFLIGDNILKIVISFFISVIVTRHFGPKIFGQLNYVNSYIGIIQVFIILGLDNIILKNLALEDYKEEEIFGSVFLIRLVMFLLVYTVGYFIFFKYFNYENLNSMYLILGFSLIFNCFYTIKQFFQIKSLSKYQVLSSQIAFIVLSILKLLIVFFSYSIFEYAYIILFSSVVEVLFLVLFYKKQGGNILRWKVNQDCINRLLKESVPLIVQSFAIYIYMKIDQIMIGKILGLKELGIYSVGVSLAELVYFIPTAISGAYYPKIAELKKNNKLIRYKNTVIKLGSLNIMIGVIFSITCTIYGNIIIKFLYGAEFKNSGMILQIYSWASIFVALGVSHSSYMILEGKQKSLLKSSILGAVTNIILNFILIKRIGIYGAAIATVLSQIIATYVYYYFIEGCDFKNRCRSFYYLINIKKVIKYLSLN